MSTESDLDPDQYVPPDTVFEDVASFHCYYNMFSVNPRTGDLTLKFVVPAAFKYEAMAITDHPSVMLKVDVQKKVFEPFGVSGGNDD